MEPESAETEPNPNGNGNEPPVTADQLTEEQVAMLREAFNKFDKNSNGTIDGAEIGQTLRVMGGNPSEKTINEMIEQLDKDENGKISFEEFCNFMASKIPQCDVEEEEMKMAFKKFDKSGDGLVSAQELKEVLCKMGDKLTDDEAAELIQDADVDQDGMISYEEFAKKMTQMVA